MSAQGLGANFRMAAYKFNPTTDDDYQTITDTYCRLVNAPDSQDWWRRHLPKFLRLHSEFHPTESMPHPQLKDVADWMNGLAEGNRHRRRLDRISVPDAIKLAQRWRITDNARKVSALPESANDLSIQHVFEDGFRIVRLNSDKALSNEAQAMKNCLHDSERFAASEIFSLRDQSNKSLATIEIRNGLLIQVKGRANSILTPQHHPYLRSFLENRGIPSSDISSRLNLFTLNGKTYGSLTDCVHAFSSWADEQDLSSLPFMRHPTIREFLNIFARFGRDADEELRAIVVSYFRPDSLTWRHHEVTKLPAPLSIRICQPQFPGALFHLSRYGAVPREVVVDTYRNAISALLDHAIETPTNFYDIAARNPILSPEVFDDILRRTETEKRFDEVRHRLREIKRPAIQRALKILQALSNRCISGRNSSSETNQYLLEIQLKFDQRRRTKRLIL